MTQSTHSELSFNDYLISTDKSKLDLYSIHNFLSQNADWSKGIPLATVQKSIENSLCFGLYHMDRQIGFARVISDFSTVAYLGDVYILEEFRGKGLSSRLMDFIMNHTHLQGLRRWILLTSSADWLYEKYGFKKLNRPEIYMELHNPEIYKRD